MRTWLSKILTWLLGPGTARSRKKRLRDFIEVLKTLSTLVLVVIEVFKAFGGA